jgi:hypothetical protein
MITETFLRTNRALYSELEETEGETYDDEGITTDDELEEEGEFTEEGDEDLTFDDLGEEGYPEVE